MRHRSSRRPNPGKKITLIIFALVVVVGFLLSKIKREPSTTNLQQDEIVDVRSSQAPAASTATPAIAVAPKQLAGGTSPVAAPSNDLQTRSDMELPGRIKGRDELLISHTAYTVSYNCQWRIPNWVAYQLLPAETSGEAHRKDDFMPDPKVPARYTAETSDYRRSGYDRGHMIPSADVKWSQQANDETFYLSNICPQNSNLNRGIWNSLEEQVRDWAYSKGEVFVVCGPIVADNYPTIGSNRVAIPDSFFKAVLCRDGDGWQTIAFVFPNQSGNRLLSTYALTVNELEALTGIDFFVNLPDEIEESVEDKVEWEFWSRR